MKDKYIILVAPKALEYEIIMLGNLNLNQITRSSVCVVKIV